MSNNSNNQEIPISFEAIKDLPISKIIEFEKDLGATED